MAKETRGRKSYKNKIMSNLELIKDLRRKGYSVVQVSEQLGLSCKTLYLYAKDEPSIQIALDTDKEIKQLELEESLRYHATKKFMTKYVWVSYVFDLHGNIDEYPNEDKRKVGPNWYIRIPTEDIPYTPNQGMLSFALTNLDRKKWKNTQEVDISVNENETVESTYQLIDTLKGKGE